MDPFKPIKLERHFSLSLSIPQYSIIKITNLINFLFDWFAFYFFILTWLSRVYNNQQKGLKRKTPRKLLIYFFFQEWIFIITLRSYKILLIYDFFFCKSISIQPYLIATWLIHPFIYDSVFMIRSDFVLAFLIKEFD